MNIQPFSGLSRTITTERSSIGRPFVLRRLLAWNMKLESILEEVIDVNRDLDVYTNHQISLLNPQVLYKTNMLSFHTQLLRINREEEILMTKEPINLKLISKESSRKIR